MEKFNLSITPLSELFLSFEAEGDLNTNVKHKQLVFVYVLGSRRVSRNSPQLEDWQKTTSHLRIGRVQLRIIATDGKINTANQIFKKTTVCDSFFSIWYPFISLTNYHSDLRFLPNSQAFLWHYIYLFYSFVKFIHRPSERYMNLTNTLFCARLLLQCFCVMCRAAAPDLQ